jgi:hypothetical protein
MQAAAASDGTGCVWCSLSTIGFCVSASQAQQMKTQIPGLTCDDDEKSDDDNTPSPPDDDGTPPATDDATPAPDDDKTQSDDRVVPEDYWTCLKDYKTEKDCAGGGCVWCVSKMWNVRRKNLPFWITTIENEIQSHVIFDLSLKIFLLVSLFHLERKTRVWSLYGQGCRG